MPARSTETPPRRGDATPPPAGALEDAGAEGPDLPVNGSAIDTHLTQGGDVLRAQDLSRANITALIPDAAGERFTTYPGVGTVDGHFAIPGVPEGEYYLHAQLAYSNPLPRTLNYYLVTDARTVDLGAALLGRPEQRSVFTTTNLALRLTNLTPWSEFDWLSLGIPNVNGFEQNLGDYAIALLPGASSVTATFDYSRVVSPAAVSPQAGDVAYLGQHALVLSTLGAEYHALTRFLSSSTLSLDGGTGTLTGALVNVARTRSAPMRFCRSKYADLANDVAPGAEPPLPGEDFWPMSVEVSPFGGARDLRPLSPEGPWLLAQYRADAVPTDVDLGNVTFGDPFPPEWPVFGRIRAWYVVPRAAGRAAPFFQQLTFEVEAPIDQLAVLGCAPPLGPPRAPRIDGLDAYVDRTGTGRLTPTLSWSPPRVGRANAYLVVVYGLVAVAGRTEVEERALIHTEANHVVIPPGLLASGQSYDFEIVALLRSGSQLRVAPFQPSRPMATASTITAVYAP